MKMRKEDGVSKILVLLIVVVIILVVGCFIANMVYNSLLEPVQDNSEKVVVVIEGGISGVAEQLEESGIIKSANAFKIYCKINECNSMQAGKYELDKNMSVQEIIEVLNDGQVVDETVTITFIEGKNMRDVAALIAEKTNNTEDDVFNLLQDDDYLDSLIEDYWFIDDDIKDDDIYYALEGYLYPDTYILENADESVESIFSRLLNKMDTVLSKYKDEIEDSKYSVHEFLSLASVVELEAGNEEDRAEVAGVFYNRLNKNMALQSDVTTYYALKLDMNERDLTATELSKNNPYNTRATSMAGKLPIGPICMVSESSISAAVEPKDTDALFFVADKNGKVYFSETNSEHDEKVQELKDNGLWYEYED